MEHGLEAALGRRKRDDRPRLVDGEVEVPMIALSCSAPPEGHARWTLRRLADRLVELDIVPFPRDRSAGFKKTNSAPT